MIKNNKKILKYMCITHIMQLKKTFKYIVYVTNCCVKESSRRGAVVALDNNKAQAIAELRDSLRMLLAKGICKNITREEIHAMVDECYDDYEQ